MNKEFEDEIWESFLKAAVIENSQNENRDYPSEQELKKIHIPEHYDLKIRQLIRYYNYQVKVKSVMKYCRKIASIMLLFMGFSFALLLQHNEVRAACKNVIIEIYDRYITLIHTSDLPQGKPFVEVEYIPEGFSIIDSSSDDIKYKNLGITAISPDFSSIENMIKIADNFNIPYNLIDPDNPDSIGINPFIFDDPLKTAIAISSALRSMYQTTHTDVEEAFRDNVATQAIENLSILLKVMYPKLNDGDLPNLSDMLEMLTDFDLAEEMCRKMEYDDELSVQYKMLIAYFKKNFYRSGSGRADTEKFVYSAVTQLDNLLRIEGVRNILCNRNDNINFDEALENGEVTFVCTRRGDLGAATHKAFGLFFILLMQNSVLRRPGNEKNRVPHFLYIDEFPDFICKDIDVIFTLYRKYRVGTLIATQNLEQLGSKVYSRYRQTILANCSNKLLFGGATPDDREWWSKEFGNKRKWKFKNDYHTSKGTYDEKYGQIEYGWTEYFKPDKLGSLKAKQCAYKILNPKGGIQVGKGKVDHVDSKYKEKQKVKFFNFEKFTSGISDESDSKLRRKPKFNYGNVDFTDTNNSAEIDPIKTDTSDSNFLFDNDDAIIVDLKRGNSNK